MLRFAVFDDNGPATDYRLDGAHLLGPDDLPVAGKVAFKGGEILCRHQGGHTRALGLMHDAGRCGRLMLQTCLLPEREKPYLLTVELARHRIKCFIAKSEEWQMFDLADSHRAMLHWNEARQLLTEALTAGREVDADRAARLALELATQAGEELAMAHAEILLHRRYAGRAASSATLGVRVFPGRDSRGLREVIESSFDLLVLPFRWRDIEVEEGTYDWAPLDRWMEWARSVGKPIVAGPLIDFSKRAVPEWMHVWQHDYDTCRDLVYDYMEKVVHRYRGVVGMWNLASGINVNENFEFTEAQMLDLTRTANLLVRHSRKGARTMVEVRQPFGEHASSRPGSMLPLAFVDRLTQEGIKLDAVGVQLVFGEKGSGRCARDLMQISSLLDRFFMLEIPVLVSAVGVPSAPSATGGSWHGAWSPELQGRWVSRVFPLAMSKPFVESIFWGELYDHPDADLKAGGLIDAAGKPKPAFTRLVGARCRLRKPLGAMKVAGKADA